MRRRRRRRRRKVYSKLTRRADEGVTVPAVQVRGEFSFGDRRDSLLAQLGPHGWPEYLRLRQAWQRCRQWHGQEPREPAPWRHNPGVEGGGGGGKGGGRGGGKGKVYSKLTQEEEEEEEEEEGYSKLTQ